MHLREGIYVGIVFALIASCLWVAVVNAPNEEVARAEETVSIELEQADQPGNAVRLGNSGELFDESSTGAKQVRTQQREAELFTTGATAFDDRSDEHILWQDESPDEQVAVDEVFVGDDLQPDGIVSEPQLAVIADAETGSVELEGARSENPYFDATNVTSGRDVSPEVTDAHSPNAFGPKSQRVPIESVSERMAKRKIAEPVSKADRRNDDGQRVVKRENDASKMTPGKTDNVQLSPQTLPATSATSDRNDFQPNTKQPPSLQVAKPPLTSEPPLISELPATSDLPATIDSNPTTAIVNANPVEVHVAANSDVRTISLPADLIWWKEAVRKPIAGSNETESVGLDALLNMALLQSPSIIAISQQPLIERQEVIRSDAAFDPELFMRTQFDNRNDPVGNTLTTGGEPFLQDKIWSGKSGVRKKLRTGASLDVAQELGFKNSNSQFFQPQDQGTSTLSLNFSQPLLRGGGRMYNVSRVYLAQTFADAAQERYHSELQDELLKVAEAYWKLYYSRCRLVQIRNNIARGEEVLQKLESRAEFDALPTQIARARAAVLSRKAQVANALRDVRNAETTIRKLIAAPNWAARYNVELLPLEQPIYDHVKYPVDKVVETALEVRPEIKQALQRAKSASIQLDISRNELLPELNMLLGGYVAGLEGNSGVFPAYAEQFGTVPGYYAGFEFNLPYRNRQARSTVRQRELNLRKITAEVEVAVQDIVADAQISLRQVNSAHETLATSISSIQAAHADLKYQKQRWESFAFLEGDFADGQNPSTLLDQLLESQQRLTNEELAFSRAEFDFKVAQFYLKKAMGTLLQTAQQHSQPANRLSQ